MTVENVRNAVIGFGYDYGLDDAEGAFTASLPIAIREINALRPRTATAVIVHEPYAPVSEDYTTHLHMPSDTLTFTGMARSAIFEVDGEGDLSVTATNKVNDAVVSYDVYIDDNNVSSLHWNTSTGWKRIAVSTGTLSTITLTFSGSNTYHVRNVCFFDAVGTIGLKYGEYIDYDLSTIASNYEGVKYILRDNVDYTKYQIVNNKQLRLLASDTGTYEVIYRTKVNVWTTNSSVIPLDDDLAELVPLLVASYAWLDDNATRAQYYRALYERQAGLIERERVNVRMVDRRGWS